MVNKIFVAFSETTMVLNRILAWLDFAVHYISGYFLYYLAGGYKPQYHTRPTARDEYSPTVLVTGASQGIGLATALYLSKKGYSVFAGVKDEKELERIHEEIRNQHTQPNLGSIRPIIMDVLHKDSIDDAVREVTFATDNSEDHPFVGVINNAGYCLISAMELTPDKAVRDLFELDFWAYIAVIKAFLPLIKRNQGRFINVVSYGAYVNPPMWVPYSSAKAALEAMTRAWRFELIPFGVGMTSIRPGWTRTHGVGPKISKGWEAYFENVNQDAAGVDSLGDVVKTDKRVGGQEKEVYGSMMTKWHRLVMAAADGIAQTAEVVAQSIYDAMTDPFLQPYYTVGYDALIGQTVRDLCPESIYEVAMSRTFGPGRGR